MPTYAGFSEGFLVHAPKTMRVGETGVVAFSFEPPSDPGDTLIFQCAWRTPNREYIPGPAIDDASGGLGAFGAQVFPLAPTSPQFRAFYFTPTRTGSYLICCMAANTTVGPNLLTRWGFAIVQVSDWAGNMDAPLSTSAKELRTDIQRSISGAQRGGSR